MSRAKIAVTLGLLLFGINEAPAQDSSVMPLTSEVPVSGPLFLSRTQPGAMGVVAPQGCSAKPSLNGKTVHLVREQVYWHFPDQCIRIVLNHRGLAARNTPTFVGVRVVGYFKAAQENTVILRRAGRFNRSDGTKLPEMRDTELTGNQMTLNRFDEIHGSTTFDNQQYLQSFIVESGVEWHGVPDGGSDNTWDHRARFRSTTTFDTQLNLQYKVLDNRLIRIEPFPVDGTPPEGGPFSIDIRRRGNAEAIAVRVFSPAGADFGGQFALIYSTDKNYASSLLTSRIAGGCLFQFLCK
jgi:hypothetical protein